MRTRIAYIPSILGLWAVICTIASGGAADRPAIPDSEFHQRRMQVVRLLDSSSAALFHAAEVQQRNGDVSYPFRQESNYMYLTGDAEPGGLLVLLGKNIAFHGHMAAAIFMDGPRRSDSLVWQNSGPELLVAADALPEVLDSVCAHASSVYISAPGFPFVNDWLNGKPVFFERDARREFERAHPGVKVKNAAALTSGLRLVKSQAELALMRQAIRITGDGIRRAMQACAPEAFEYELQAAVEYDMVRQGAGTVAFPSIIGSGPNALNPHYDRNTRQMQKGDLVVMDVGAELSGYAADVTRTIPVSGTFTDAQRAVYNIVRAAHDEVIKLITPGVPARALEAKARDVIAAAGYGKFILHGVSHQVGLDVHDAGLPDSLTAGMVVTVEPGIYIPGNADSVAPEFRGIGIRIEDDVLVTPDGREVLSAAIPADPDAIEEAMKRP